MKKIDSIIKVFFRKKNDKKQELNVTEEQHKRVIIVVKKSSKNLMPYFNGVLNTVKKLLTETKDDFVLQSQVGHILKQNKISLPVTLGEFFKVYSSVFKTSVHPVTNALTVTIRSNFR